MDLPFKIESREGVKIMFATAIANAIEIGRLLIMTGPILVWPILTLILEDRRRKIEKGN